MSDKLFTIGGTSVLAGAKTWRFATGKMSTRVGVLKRGGHTEIDLSEIPLPGLTKADWVTKMTAEGKTAVMPTSSKKAATPAPTTVQTAEQKKAAKAAKDKARREAKKAEKAKATPEPNTATDQVQEPATEGSGGTPAIEVLTPVDQGTEAAVAAEAFETQSA